MSATEPQPAPPAGELMTEDEHRAVRLAGELWTLVTSRIIGHGRSRPGDVSELTALVHGIQRMVMKQAAARAYPDLYRLLGEELPAPVVVSCPDHGPHPHGGTRCLDCPVCVPPVCPVPGHADPAPDVWCGTCRFRVAVDGCAAVDCDARTSRHTDPIS